MQDKLSKTRTPMTIDFPSSFLELGIRKCMVSMIWKLCQNCICSKNPILYGVGLNRLTPIEKTSASVCHIHICVSICSRTFTLWYMIQAIQACVSIMHASLLRVYETMNNSSFCVRAPFLISRESKNQRELAGCSYMPISVWFLMLFGFGLWPKSRAWLVAMHRAFGRRCCRAGSLEWSWKLSERRWET